MTTKLPNSRVSFIRKKTASGCTTLGVSIDFLKALQKHIRTNKHIDSRGNQPPTDQAHDSSPVSNSIDGGDAHTEGGAQEGQHNSNAVLSPSQMLANTSDKSNSSDGSSPTEERPIQEPMTSINKSNDKNVVTTKNGLFNKKLFGGKKSTKVEPEPMEAVEAMDDYPYTIHEVVEQFIRPLVTSKDASLVEFLAGNHNYGVPHPKLKIVCTSDYISTANVYVSHCYNYTFNGLVDSLEAFIVCEEQRMELEACSLASLEKSGKDDIEQRVPLTDDALSDSHKSDKNDDDHCQEDGLRSISFRKNGSNNKNSSSNNNGTGTGKLLPSAGADKREPTSYFFWLDFCCLNLFPQKHQHNRSTTTDTDTSNTSINNCDSKQGCVYLSIDEHLNLMSKINHTVLVFQPFGSSGHSVPPVPLTRLWALYELVLTSVSKVRLSLQFGDLCSHKQFLRYLSSHNLDSINRLLATHTIDLTTAECTLGSDKRYLNDAIFQLLDDGFVEGNTLVKTLLDRFLVDTAISVTKLKINYIYSQLMHITEHYNTDLSGRSRSSNGGGGDRSQFSALKHTTITSNKHTRGGAKVRKNKVAALIPETQQHQQQDNTESSDRIGNINSNNTHNNNDVDYRQRARGGTRGAEGTTNMSSDAPKSSKSGKLRKQKRTQVQQSSSESQMRVSLFGYIMLAFGCFDANGAVNQKDGKKQLTQSEADLLQTIGVGITVSRARTASSDSAQQTSHTSVKKPITSKRGNKSKVGIQPQSQPQAQSQPQSQSAADDASTQLTSGTSKEQSQDDIQKAADDLLYSYLFSTDSSSSGDGHHLSTSLSCGESVDSQHSTNSLQLYKQNNEIIHGQDVTSGTASSKLQERLTYIEYFKHALNLTTMYMYENDHPKVEAIYLSLLRQNEGNGGDGLSCVFAANFITTAAATNSDYEDGSTALIFVTRSSKHNTNNQRFTLPESHPIMLSINGNLAVLYKIQKRFALAIDKNLEILQVKEELLGAVHPSVLLTTYNLACCYKEYYEWLRNGGEPQQTGRSDFKVTEGENLEDDALKYQSGGSSPLPVNLLSDPLINVHNAKNRGDTGTMKKPLETAARREPSEPSPSSAPNKDTKFASSNCSEFDLQGGGDGDGDGNESAAMTPRSNLIKVTLERAITIYTDIMKEYEANYADDDTNNDSSTGDKDSSGNSYILTALGVVHRRPEIAGGKGELLETDSIQDGAAEHVLFTQISTVKPTAGAGAAAAAENSTTDKLVDFDDDGGDMEDVSHIVQPTANSNPNKLTSSDENRPSHNANGEIETTKVDADTRDKSENESESEARVPESTAVAATVHNKHIKNQPQQKLLQKKSTAFEGNNNSSNSIAIVDPGVTKLYLDSINNVAVLLLEQREEEAAKKLLQKLLRLKIKLYGELHLETLTTYESVGILHSNAANNTIVKYGVQFTEYRNIATLVDSTAATATSTVNANASMASGSQHKHNKTERNTETIDKSDVKLSEHDYNKKAKEMHESLTIAYECFNKSVRIRELLYGANHFDTIQTLTTLAKYKHRNSCFTARFSSFEEQIDSFKETLDMFLKITSFYESNLVGNGKLDLNGDRYFRHCYKVPAASSSATTSNSNSNTNSSNTTNSAVSSKDTETLPMGDRMHPSLITYYETIAELYVCTQQYGKAEVLLQALQANKEVVYGPNALTVQITLSNLADVCMKQEKFVLAERYYIKAISGRQNAQGRKHFDTIHTQYSYALCLIKLKKLKEAAVLLQNVLAAFDEFYKRTASSVARPTNSTSSSGSAVDEAQGSERSVVHTMLFLQGTEFSEPPSVHHTQRTEYSLLTCEHLGSVYAKLELFSKSRDIYERLRQYYKAHFGHNHQVTIGYSKILSDMHYK